MEQGARVAAQGLFGSSRMGPGEKLNDLTENDPEICFGYCACPLGCSQILVFYLFSITLIMDNTSSWFLFQDHKNVHDH